jgi:hypothetical protein
LVYADPPYPPETRVKKRVYRFEFTDEQHRQLLECLNALGCHAAVSTYPNDAYKKALTRARGWHEHRTWAMTRGGVQREEVLYVRTNPTGSALRHTHTTAGINYRDRDRIKQKTKRWVAKLAKMTEPEQDAVITALLQQRQRQR